MKQRVLFVCVHNSARSPIAEAWLNHHCGEYFEAHSAGLNPGSLNPLAVLAMNEVGIDISKKQPQAVFDVFKSGKAFAYVISTCDQARGEKCPIFPGGAKRIDWSFQDPASFVGSNGAKLEQMRFVRDAILKQVESWCETVCPQQYVGNHREIFMKLSEFKNELAQNPGKNVQFVLPTGSKIPVHSHVTDVARIDKRFVDCGGTFRTESLCRLQAWFADDTDHRLLSEKLLKILGKAATFLENDELDVEIEHEAPFISQFPVKAIEVQGEALVVLLGTKHTECLAPELCIPPSRATSIGFKPLPSFQPTKCC